MKKRYLLIRLIVLIVIGLVLIYKTVQFKYSNFFFDTIIFVALLLPGLVLWIWSLYYDLKSFRKQKEWKYLLTLITGLLLISIISILYSGINSNFNKPTLLKVFYDGDFNGTAIDFKNDGTYIFDNSAIGLSNYQYGTYRLTGNEIVLDKKEIDNVIKSGRLKIKEKETGDTGGVKKELYLFQVDESGKVLENETEFRVVIDNRKDKNTR